MPITARTEHKLALKNMPLFSRNSSFLKRFNSSKKFMYKVMINHVQYSLKFTINQ